MEVTVNDPITLNQIIKHDAMLVDRTPQVVLLAVDPWACLTPRAASSGKPPTTEEGLAGRGQVRTRLHAVEQQRAYLFLNVLDLQAERAG